ncbi:MAG: hypothetical protein ACI9LN_000594, partial [Saprospiraceae bacterium]
NSIKIHPTLIGHYSNSLVEINSNFLLNAIWK